VTLFTTADLASWFGVDDPCGVIAEYNVNSATGTGMTAQNSPELYVLLDVANRAALGAVTVDTSYDAATIGDVTAVTTPWYMEGAISRNTAGFSAPITITIICGQVTEVTSTYNSANGNAAVSEKTNDGFSFAIEYTSISTSETVDIPTVETYATN